MSENDYILNQLANSRCGIAEFNCGFYFGKLIKSSFSEFLVSELQGIVPSDKIYPLKPKNPI